MRALKGHFSDWKSAWCAKGTVLASLGIPSPTVSRFLVWRKTADPKKFIHILDKDAIRFLFCDEPDFPVALLNSSDPPDILFVRGTIPDALAVSVVGTRRVTAYGRRCTEAIVSPLAEVDLLIVSGMALGVDAIAHRSAMDAGGKTLAVLGTGIDEDALYPRENVSLAHQIIESGGAVVSEFPPGTGSRKEHFPIRNRLIAGWSLATVVIEASLKSGSLITAKSALEENREVLAVPGPIWSEGSQGPNQLLKNGAKPCTSSQDVLDALALDHPELATKARAELPVDPQDRSIIEALKEPLHVDMLARQTGLIAHDLGGRLAILELKKLVKQIGGQMWIRT